jgi:cation/acetate symporter
MSALTNPINGAPLVDVAKTLADPKWIADVPASAANPLQSKVGWFGLNNINCGLLGMPLGFIIMWVVSRLGPEPSREMQAMVDEIRKPRGRTVLEEH